MIAFQLVVQHRAAGVLTSTNFNLDALVHAIETQGLQNTVTFDGQPMQYSVFNGVGF